MYAVDVKELKHLLVDNDLPTIESIAEKTGVNRNTISGVLNGSVYPSSMVMQKIVDALGLTAEQAGKIFFAKKLAQECKF